MTWFLSLSRWFGPRKSAGASVPSSPERERIRQDQRELADHIETLFRQFDERLQHLAQRSHELSEAEFSRESQRIRSAQDELRRALRRVEASVKPTQQLARELEQWERRAERMDADAQLHADHPDVRTEILRSELALRRGEFAAPRVEHKDERPLQDVVDLLKQQLQPEVEPEPEMIELQEAPSYEFRSVEPLPSIEPAQLIIAIRDATREAERWHALQTSSTDDEALMQVRHVRELHALLKRIDRARGIRRDRMTFAIRMSDE